VSFLSRFIGNKKKGLSDEELEHESEPSDSRPEGMDAKLFSQPIENIEFNPRHPQPPPYIKVRSKYKKEKEFDRVFLAQELRVGSANPAAKRTPTINYPSTTGTPSQVDDEDTIWALEFSKDGKYLASGGQDKIVRVWAVISTPEERRQHERETQENRQGDRPLRMSAAVFQSSVYREYEGHEGSVIALSWSKVSSSNLYEYTGTNTCRTTFCCRHQETRLSAYGTSVDQNVCAPSSTPSTSCLCSFIQEMTDSSWLAHGT
jgi:WD40 repeat protein